MLILCLNNHGNVHGKLFIENAFTREKDYLSNSKVIKLKTKDVVENIVLITTCDIEYRLVGNQSELLISAYPANIDTFAYVTRTYKLFPIKSLTIPLYPKWHYKKEWEKTTVT